MDTNRGADQERDTSQLFLVRLWIDNTDGGGSMEGDANQVQGKVQHVLSGEAASFNDWHALMQLLTGMMHQDTQHPTRNLREK